MPSSSWVARGSAGPVMWCGCWASGSTTGRPCSCIRGMWGVSGVAVWHVGAGDQHGQQPSAGVGHDVALAAVSAFAGVVAAAGSRNGVGAAHSLGVERSARRCVLRPGGPVPEACCAPGFARLLDRAGLRRVRFHDLRHSCATLLYDRGAHDPGDGVPVAGAGGSLVRRHRDLLPRAAHSYGQTGRGGQTHRSPGADSAGGCLILDGQTGR